MKKLFDEIPYLESDRLVLRKITEDDRETLQEMAHSDIIYRYEPTYLLEQQYTDMDQLLHDLYGEYFEKNRICFWAYSSKTTPLSFADWRNSTITGITCIWSA